MVSERKRMSFNRKIADLIFALTIFMSDRTRADRYIFNSANHLPRGNHLRVSRVPIVWAVAIP